MKSKYVILASALLISVATFAQKDQIKAAEKALKGGNSAEAVTILQAAEAASATAPDGEKAQYFFVKGNAYLDLANKKVEEGKNLSLAAKAYQDLLAVEKASGKDKYSSQATTSILDIKFKLLNSAVEDTKTDKQVLDCITSENKILEDYKLTLNANNQKDYENLIEKKRKDLRDCEEFKIIGAKKGAKKLYDAYLLDKKDTINLYYAASTYVNAKDYVTALKLYYDLKALNYSGKGTSYLAMNKLTSEEDLFTTAKERDLAVKIGTHEKPKMEVIPSKRGEIYKNIALILVQDGKTEEAKKAISDARKANPEDTSLILTEANLYLETKDFEMYKKLIAEALEKNPNDADLIFNLGVISANAKNPLEAEKYYKKVMEVDPKYINAYINLAALKLEDEKVIIDEMNKLGASATDMKRYEVLKNKRLDLFKSTIPYLQKAVELDSTNIDVAKTLLNVYSALEMMPEAKALKAKIKEQEGK
jgi:tetratricopeptide (TPR) repeat protein